MKIAPPLLASPLLLLAIAARTTAASTGHPAEQSTGFSTSVSLEPAPRTPAILFRYPLRMPDWWHTVNYVDLQAGVGILDYGCHAVTYDGHAGNDLLIRDFVAMDEGRFVLAAAPGTVIAVQDGYFDRNTSSSSTPANLVAIRHADGTETYYLHLAKWSSLVYAGQSVFEGQPLGLVGSSGNSSDPHLHFEVKQGGSVYEPGAGACRSGTSLWKSQQGHVFDNAASLYDAGMVFIRPDPTSIKLRPANVTHWQQTGDLLSHFVWVKLADVHSGDVSRVNWRRPDNTLYDFSTLTHASYLSYSWYYFESLLPPSGPYGNWKVEYLLNGVLKAQMTFAYNTSPYQAPVASGRAGGVLHGALRGRLNGSDADGEVKEFRLSSGPVHGEATLSGPRRQYFSYTPESGYSGTDTFQFVVEDAQGTVSAPGTMTLNVPSTLENALRLEGEDDYVSAPGSGSLDLAGSFTLEAWIRRSAGSSGWQSIIDRRHPTLLDSGGYSLSLTPDSRVRLGAGTGAAAVYALGSTPIPFDRWVHVAGTWDGASLRVYVGAIPDAPAVLFAGPISYTGVGETRIGGSFIPGDSFRGEIEEARIWNLARGQSDLEQGGTCLFFDNPLPASVKAWWRLQGSAADSSPSGNNGTRVAGASFLRTDSAFALGCLLQNSDGEGGPDGLDNCPLDPNPTQANLDGDGSGDACDLCPLLASRADADTDRDGVGDACDNCPFVGNTEQADSDADGAGDLCDPAPGNGVQSVPSDQIALTIHHGPPAGISTLSWTPGPFAAGYEVYRGSLPEVRARFYGTCQSSRDANTTDTTFTEPEAPAAGEAFYFLAVGVAADGTRGLAGLDSEGRQRDLRAKDCL